MIAMSAAIAGVTAEPLMGRSTTRRPGAAEPVPAMIFSSFPVSDHAGPVFLPMDPHAFSPSFHPATIRWFTETLGEPTEAQRRGWKSIGQGRHTLIAAPTGSGKTLAAFLTAIDGLLREGLRSPIPDEVQVVYVSPLKALSADVHKNLSEPLEGIRASATELGLTAPPMTARVRTGDTPQSERAAMLRRPPHILVTTPESLYLLLTAEQSRRMLRSVRTVIVDEIHAVIGTRRGAHLAITLERLQAAADAPLLRIGLSATQKPIDEVARFLVGSAEVTDEGVADCDIVNEGHRRAMDLGVEIPGSTLEAVMSSEIWVEYYDRLAQLIAAHRTTLVFVNTRRMAERVARHLSERLGEDAVTAHHGSLSKEKRLDAEGRLKRGQLKALVATASLELGIDIGYIDLACQIGSPHRIATFIQRIGRSGHSVSGMPKGRLFPVSRDDLIECAALLRAVHRGELDAIVARDCPLDVLTQQVVAEAASVESSEDALFALVRRAWPFHSLQRRDFDSVIAMAADGFATRRGRRGALLHRDEVQGRLRGRRGARLVALTSGGAIPEVADYRVVLDPDDTFVGTLNEDFAIESMSGDVFQLGNASWRVLQVAAGTVRVADAHGAPPNIPFWLGEAPARSDELSRAVSDLRAELEILLRAGTAATEPPATAIGFRPAIEWITSETGLSIAAAEQVAAYLSDSLRALGVLPTQDTLVLERFFDESGGMQLVLHAPFGSRVNRAWGLALRKRFCRQFNFELQAAATEDSLLLSLGPQHSFPLSDVFRYLHPATARDVLVQAFLDAPVFQTRWRWNTTISLAVPRYRGGRKVPPQLQRMLADDLMAAVFPDAAACLENIPGDRQVPDHPLVAQTVRDCLDEAMDVEQLAVVLTRIHAGDLRLISRDTPEPSPLAHEILTARPYAFLDDAPLEERRTQAVYARRATEPSSGGDIGALDAAAIERVADEARPDPRDPDELHDALLISGFLAPADLSPDADRFMAVLLATRRAAGAAAVWFASERLPELIAVHPEAVIVGNPATPSSRSIRGWAREEAIAELLRSRLSITGPTTARALAASLSIDEEAATAALMTLESEGVVLRGSFTRRSTDVEWCERGLLARIHRYTLTRLRAEIEPVSPADFMRFLITWQHVDGSNRLTGAEGLRTALSALDGYELAARAWERSVLPARVEHYDPSMLDLLCLTGEVGWARLSSPSRPESANGAQLGGATPVALFLREHGRLWHALRRGRPEEAPDDAHREARQEPRTETWTDGAQRVLAALDTRGASFSRDLCAQCGLDETRLGRALGELVGAGVVTSDGFAGLRAVVRATNARPAPADQRGAFAGRWSLLDNDDEVRRDEAIEAYAWSLLRRYGVVFRRVLAREALVVNWRELTRVYRRLEARGEIRGGRFVSGMAGEQFATTDAVARLREVRRTPVDGRMVAISAADPLNLIGIVTSGERVRAVASSRIVFRDGIALAALEGEYVRRLTPGQDALPSEAVRLLAGRYLPPLASGFVGATRAASSL
ncbi:MAG: DEAD/DEAH box helicase [Luteitalea sp.]|nr:DEAD/DEAH box helicase [Luteitalea sp.]